MRLFEHNLVAVQEPRDLDRRLLSTLRRTRNQRHLGHIRSHGDADTAQRLDALGDGVHELRLFLKVLIEEQMKLIEGRARNLPMVLLVEIAQDHGVREDLVEILDTLTGGAFGEGVRQPSQLSVGLNLVRLLMIERPRAISERASISRLGHGWSSSGLNGTTCNATQTTVWMICSMAASKGRRSHSPSYLLPLRKNVGVPLTPLRTPLMKSSRTRTA